MSGEAGLCAKSEALQEKALQRRLCGGSGGMFRGGKCKFSTSRDGQERH